MKHRVLVAGQLSVLCLVGFGWNATARAGALSFSNIQPSSRVAHTSSRGGAWGDYDGDGYQDLWTGAAIYRNLEGRGVFQRVAVLPRATSGSRAGTAWADYNNDGWLDLFVGSQWLFENQGGTGRFLLRSSAFGLDGDFASQAVTWGDYDQDGWVDIYVVGDQSAEGAVYRNLRGTGFDNVTRALGVADPREGYGGGWCDPDGDGDLDLHIGNCDDNVLNMRMDVYFENQAGTYVERGREVGLRNTSDSWVTAWADYDNDGDMDVFVANTSGADHFYRNDGVRFVDMAGQRGIPNGSTREASWGDFDNDGFLDLYVGLQNGRNRLYRNNGDGTFTDIARATGVDDGGSTVVASVADMDNDGDLDLYVGNSNGRPGLYRNDLGPSSWLIVRLEGTDSNRSAIGARVIVTTGNITRMRDVLGGNGLYTQPMLPVHFGLGNATRVDRLEIRWPSGLVQEVLNVPANQILCITENSDPVEECLPVSGGQSCPALLSCQANGVARTVSLLWDPGFNLDAAGFELRRNGELIATPGLGDGSFIDRSAVFPRGERVRLVYELKLVGGGDANICSALTCQTTATAADNRPPIPAFRADPGSGPAPLTVSFDASASSDLDGEVVDHKWTFGDGQQDTGVMVSHTYDGPGVYIVILTVSDDYDATASAATNINVQAAGGVQLPGDCDQDGVLNISDPVCLLGILFVERDPALPCQGPLSAGANRALFDFNGDGRVDLSDAVSELSFLFVGGGPHVLGEACRRFLDCPDNTGC